MSFSRTEAPCADGTTELSPELAIQVNGLGKCYAVYSSPRDRLKQFVLPRLQRLLLRQPTQYFREFWALKNVSFEIKRGDTVGIIGRNGSGKSTLLQIVCGTLSPTTGTVKTSGRIAALLELGAGFNPEFTGRENVYMSAAVLGLNKDEIDARFKDIVAFADMQEFIDQPVKTYSTGMYVRLAFATMAHVDADILVVDEALAVGDAVFVQKCMRFIRAFQERGTLLFVSHDMSAVQNLCSTAVWLDHGGVVNSGPSKQIAEAYLHHTLQAVYGEAATLSKVERTKVVSAEPKAASAIKPKLDYESKAQIAKNISAAAGWKTGTADIVSVVLQSLNKGQSDVLEGGERVSLRITAKANAQLERPILGFLFKDRLGQDLFGENTLPFTSLSPRVVAPGQTFVGEFVFKLPMLPNGQYAVMASVADGDLYDNVQHHWLHDALIVNVSSSKVRWGLVGIEFEAVSLETVGD